MANFGIHNSPTRIVFIVWFIAHSLAVVEKMDATIDICIILSPVRIENSLNNSFMVQAAQNLLENFEIHKRSATVALLAGAVHDADRTKGWVVSPLSDSRATLATKLNEWGMRNEPLNALWYGFDVAFVKIREKIFTHALSKYRAKAVVLVLPWDDRALMKDEIHKANLMDMAEKIRDSGTWIYILAEYFDLSFALTLTADEKRVANSADSLYKCILPLMDKIKDAIFNDLCQWQQQCEWDDGSKTWLESFFRPYVNDAKNLCKQAQPSPFNNCSSMTIATGAKTTVATGNTSPGATTPESRSEFVKVALGVAVANLVFQLIIGVLVFVCFK